MTFFYHMIVTERFRNMAYSSLIYRKIFNKYSNQNGCSGQFVAICGRLRIGKGFLDGDAVLVGAAICPASLCGAVTWPLAIMLSADRVPVKCTQSRSCTGRIVDYRNLGSEELGSVYESLLELNPVMNVEAQSFDLSVAAGNERKTSGSYYTHELIVQALLDRSLEPLVLERTRGKR